jgi:hypothetical protein
MHIKAVLVLLGLALAWLADGLGGSPWGIALGVLALLSLVALMLLRNKDVWIEPES